MHATCLMASITSFCKYPVVAISLIATMALLQDLDLERSRHSPPVEFLSSRRLHTLLWLPRAPVESRAPMRLPGRRFDARRRQCHGGDGRRCSSVATVQRARGERQRCFVLQHPICCKKYFCNISHVPKLSSITPYRGEDKERKFCNITSVAKFFCNNTSVAKNQDRKINSAPRPMLQKNNTHNTTYVAEKIHKIICKCFCNKVSVAK